MKERKTPEKILEEYTSAIKKGDTEAMVNVGLILEEQGNTETHRKSIEIGNKSCKSGRKIHNSGL